MAKIVVLGAGVSGHTAAAYLKKWLGKKHEVIVVTPNSYYQWIPSNIWVGVGRMTVDQVRFKLGEVLASQDRYDESIEEYKAILNRDHENVEILLGRVWTLLVPGLFLHFQSGCST